MFGIEAKKLEIVAMMAHTLVLEDAVWEAAVASGAFDTSEVAPAVARVKLHELVDEIGSALSMATAMASALDRLGSGDAPGGDALPDFIPEGEGWSL